MNDGELGNLKAISHQCNNKNHVQINPPPDLRNPHRNSDLKMIIKEVLETLKSCENETAHLLDDLVNLLKKNPASVCDFDESSVLAVLLRSIERSHESLTSPCLLFISKILSFTVSPRSLQFILSYLICSSGTWRPHSYQLIHELKICSSFPHNTHFFNFPGGHNSVIALPPLSKWAYQNGWTFQCWFYFEKPASSSEMQPRYLFCFRTSKGLGYSAHFLGNFLIVTSVKVTGKGLQHCVPTEFHPYRWYMLTISYVYSRWSRSELRCYVDGNLASQSEMSWMVTTTEAFDKCTLGGPPEQRESGNFSGRISSVFAFSEALYPQQISALYNLGPFYNGQFRFEQESKTRLSSTERKALYDNKITSSLMFAYNPTACDSHLCLNQSPKSNSNVFLHSPHALMKGKVRTIHTMSLHSALHCLGGIQLLYLLFNQLDFHPDPTDDVTKTALPESNSASGGSLKTDPFPIAAQIFNLIFDLVRTSAILRKQFSQTNGLLIFAQALHRSSAVHLNEPLLNGILEAARYLTSEVVANASPGQADRSSNRLLVPVFVTLLRQLFDQILFDHALWVRAPVQIQDRLYQFLADEFRVDLIVQSTRTVVAPAVFALKTYYSISAVPPKCSPSGNAVTTSASSSRVSTSERPSIQYLARIRSNILMFIKQLFLRTTAPQGEELECILNFLATVKEADDLRDVLFFTTLLMSEYPASMVPAFDSKDGIQCVFQLLDSKDECIRLYALKLLGFFLKFSKTKRKQESMSQYSVFSLIGDSLNVASNIFSMKTYNVLFELLTERVTMHISEVVLPNPDANCRIENPVLLKTIALLIIHAKRTPELLHVRQTFLEHLLSLCINHEENRRAILQMSVWQDWVIGLASLFPTTRQNAFATATVMEILRVLLYHALRYEYGGWRVWIDTLAILHSRIAFEEYRRSSPQQALIKTPTVMAVVNDDAHTRKSLSIQQSRASAVKINEMLTIEEEEQQQQDDLHSEAVEMSVTPANVDLTDTTVRRLVNNLVHQLSEDTELSSENADSATATTDANVTGEPTSNDTCSYASATPQHRGTPCVPTQPAKQDDCETNPHKPRRATPSAEPSSDRPRGVPPFRLSPFSWSYLHQILLDSVLRSVEDDFHLATVAGNTTSSCQEAVQGTSGKATTGTDPESLTTPDVLELSAAAISDFINDQNNNVYAVNLIHMVSQLADSLVTVCGGLLPLLAATTSPSVELDLLEPTQGLSLDVSISFLLRITNLADIVIFSTPINLAALEKETGMASGGILRQCLRLVCTCSVRNCLEARLSSLLPPKELLVQLKEQQDAGLELEEEAYFDHSGQATNADLADSALEAQLHSDHPFPASSEYYQRLKPKLELIERLVAGVSNNVSSHTSRASSNSPLNPLLPLVSHLSPSMQKLVSGLRPLILPYPNDFMGGIFGHTVLSPLVNAERLLQNVDIHRLHNIIYRDEEETKQVQFVTLAVVYFLSVLMVSRYRDLLDPANPLVGQTRRSSSGQPEPVSSAPPGTTQATSPVSWRLGSCAPALEQPKVPTKGERQPPSEGQASKNVTEDGTSAETNDDHSSQKGNNATMHVNYSESYSSEDADTEEANDAGEEADDDEGRSDATSLGATRSGHNTVSHEVASDNEYSAHGDEPTDEDDYDYGDEDDDQYIEDNGRNGTQPGGGNRQVIASITVSHTRTSRAIPRVDPAEDIQTIQQTVPTSNLPVSLTTGKPIVSSVIGSADQRSLVSNVISSPPPPPPQQPQQQSPPIQLGPVRSMSAFHAADNLTEKLERALGTTTPLLKEIFFDFASFLSKTLIGSHGQELFAGGLTALRQASVAVELVMLLCSQEWQNSLQKHAGLAFIELVNEGRLLAHATRDHILRVAQEADFILSRLRTLDLRRHADFKLISARRQSLRVAAEKRVGQVLAAGRHHDGVLASHCVSLIEYVMRCLEEAQMVPRALPSSEHALTPDQDADLRRQALSFQATIKRPPKPAFFRLDSWEDDSRRRRRLVLNPFGTSHPEAVLCVHPLPNATATSTDGESDNSVSKDQTSTLNSVIEANALNLSGVADRDRNGSIVEEILPFSLKADFSYTGSIDLAVKGQPQSSPDFPNGIATGTVGGLISGLPSIHRDSLSFGKLESDPSHPTVFSTPCLLIAAVANVHGTLCVTKSDFSFETDPLNEENKEIDEAVLAYAENLYCRWPFSEIRAVFTRRYLLQNIAIEIFLTSRSSVTFALPDQAAVQKVVLALPPVGIGIRYGLPQSHKISLVSPRQHFQLSNATQRWQRREMSNFDYLMFLNTIAGRSFNDLNQYPIFPWVLCNYTSKELDLNEPANYRDLSKPIGALDPARKAFFDDRFASWDDESQPAFHYGTHYSTAAFVLNYLIRLEPFTTLFLNMQGGKFDHPNRLFHSIESTWSGCMKSSTNVKELIPEFFYLPEMLENVNQYRFGKLDDGVLVDDVILPPWAKSPEDFVRINRQALESELVSCQLHHWIDLIFGYKQRGPEAIRATNVFCHLTYEGSVNWEKITDSVLRKAIEGQIQSFGQTPSQLLTEPHPPRGSALHVCPSIFTPLTQEVCLRVKLPSNSPIVAVFAHTHPTLTSQPAVVTVAANYVFAVNRWNNAAADAVRRSSLAPKPLALHASTEPDMTPSGDQQQLPADSTSKTPISSSSNRPSPASLIGSADTSPPLPLTVDSTLVTNPTANRRYLGENADPSLRPSINQFVATPDNRVIIACGYFDGSIRVFSVDTGRCVHIAYAHHSVVTCLARSEANATLHCYVATGGREGLVMLWIFNSQTMTFFSESGETA
uniref:Neurobeachin n=1 Tax=Schistocephalus solidus TaxID=70667 RepID=A0A0X3PXG3_SCHSO